MTKAAQHVPAGRQPAAGENKLREEGEGNDGGEVTQHDEGAEGEQLRSILVQGEADEGRKSYQRLSSQDTEQEGQTEAGHTAIGVGPREPEDEGELGEEDDVHEVGAEDEEAVHGVGRDGDDGGQGAARYYGASQHPHQLPAWCLQSQSQT